MAAFEEQRMLGGQVREPRMDWLQADAEIAADLRPVMEETVKTMGSCEMLLAPVPTSPPYKSLDGVAGEVKTLVEKPPVPQSGITRRAFTQMLDKTPGYAKLPTNVKKFWKQAADAFDEGGMDPRLVRGVGKMSTHVTDLKVNGTYWAETADIGINPAMKANTRTAIHEFGHHIEHSYFDMGRVSPRYAQELTAEARKLKSAAGYEFRQAQEYAAKIINRSQITYDNDKMMLLVNESKLHSVSAYAMKNEREWFAENWATYFRNPAKLMAKAPESYKLIDALAQGKLFKPVTEVAKLASVTGEARTLAKIKALPGLEGPTQRTLQATFEAAGAKELPAELQKMLDAAAKRLEKVGLDEKLAAKVALKKIGIETNIENCGLYDDAIQTLLLSVKNGNVPTVVHEFGHGIDFQVLKNARATGLDTKQTNLLRAGMVKEYTAALIKTGKMVKEDLTYLRLRWNSVADKLYAVENRIGGVSAYSLFSRQEWFAESFMKYYGTTTERALLLKKAPKTFELIDRLVKGELWPGAVSAKSKLAVASHVPMSQEIRQLADATSDKIGKLIGGKSTLDNAPMDIMVGNKHGVEVKTLISQKNDKITMHPESLSRKQMFATKNKLQGHTVVVDLRGKVPVYYYAEGFGSFRVGSMTKVTAADLKRIFKL
jgi:hypothetical protein